MGVKASNSLLAQLQFFWVIASTQPPALLFAVFFFPENELIWILQQRMGIDDYAATR